MADKWSLVITKQDHTPLAEVKNAYERKYVANLSKPSTATFSVRTDNPVLKYLFEDESKLLQVYQNNTIRFFGPIISSNFSESEGSPPTIAVSAADAGWYLSRRDAGTSEKGTTYTATDKGATANAIVAALNAIDTSQVLNSSDTSGSLGTYTAGPYKPALICIQELAHGIDGFDWYIEPILGDSTHMGKLRLAAVVGSEKPAAVFEYGTGRRNIRSLGYLRDISTEANVVWQISDSGLETSAENPTPVVLAFDSASITARGRLEEVIELSGVNNVAIRTAWAEENIRVRKNPRRVLSMTSDIDDGTGRVPKFGTGYWLGDRVPARAVSEGIVLFNGIARVYSVEVSLNNAGTAMVTPILVDEE